MFNGKDTIIRFNSWRDKKRYSENEWIFSKNQNVEGKM